MPNLMINKRIDRILDFLLIGSLCLISFFYLNRIVEVPFHPDESTYLYMSADWDLFVTNPMALAYNANDSGTRQKYRLLDPPLGRYLLGITRSAAGFSPLLADWNWARSWEENIQAGAFPSQGLLTASRLGPAGLFPFSLILIYLTGWRLGGRFLGWTSMLFLASNALVLLHTRRAMSEGVLVFTICLFMASLVFCRKRPWLIGIPTALMVCAKLSTLPLTIIGLLAIFLYAKRPIQWKPLVVQGFVFSLIFFTIYILLNPAFWVDPWKALQAAFQFRQDLMFRQTYEFSLAQPDAVLNNPWKALLSMAGNLFVTPPAIADVGNYLIETLNSAQQYLANPIHHLFRGIYLGGLMLALNMIGFLFSIKNALHLKSNLHQPWIILSAASLVQFTALLLTVTLPIQRYVMPLIPFTCLWISYSLYLFKEKAARIRFS